MNAVSRAEKNDRFWEHTAYLSLVFPKVSNSENVDYRSMNAGILAEKNGRFLDHTAHLVGVPKRVYV